MSKDRADELLQTAHGILTQVLKEWDLDCKIAIVVYDVGKERFDNVGLVGTGQADPEEIFELLVSLVLALNAHRAKSKL